MKKHLLFLSSFSIFILSVIALAKYQPNKTLDYLITWIFNVVLFGLFSYIHLLEIIDERIKEEKQ
jgi:Na+/H+ antiporter NhaC